jgi:chemotaxis protein MotB
VLPKNQTADTGDIFRETQCWLPTYAVLCMALLAFFAIPDVLSVFRPNKEPPGDQLHKQVVEMQTRTFGEIRAFLAKRGMDAGMDAVLDGASITLRLPESLLFAPDAEEILPAGFDTLNQLQELFLLQPQQTINIRGHTDDSPLPPGARFRDNGEFAALRAVQVLRHLLARGIEPWRVTAAGFGALEPLFPNTTEMNRARNRRIEFVLERRLGKE